MSGRSAYVRKKITQTKSDGNGPPRNRARSTTSSDDAGSSLNEHMPLPVRQDTGVGTTNAHLLKFSEPMRDAEQNYRQDGSQSGSSADGRTPGQGSYHRPLDDFAYARARRPNIRTEDVSGIEKSGLRSAVDKKSEGVRRGLAKAFSFGKKGKNDDFRSESAATVRVSGAGVDTGKDAMNEPDIPENAADAFQDYRILQQQSMSFQEQSVLSPVASEYSQDVGGALYPPPSTKLPPIPPAPITPPIKRWIGSGRPVQRWNKLRKDPELWDPNGDVLVFFGHKGQQPRPNPSFRLSSHIIESTESRHLITMLREGSTEDDIQLPPSPIGAPPMLQRNLVSGASPQHLGPHGFSRGSYGAMGQPTPPISEDASLVEADGQISYEMYFPAPAGMTKIEQLRHHITTRNVFALLYHASLVGLTLYQALADLHARLEIYMQPDADNLGNIINYLGARGIDDVRNDPESAVSLLAWSESPNVRWEEGWRESFLHCAGMYAGLEACADFKYVTPITRNLLDRACLETQLRVQTAEERLAEFQYADMWPSAVKVVTRSSGPVMPNPAKGAADRLQKFLLSHYTRMFGRWPPLPPPPVTAAPGLAIGGDSEEEMWLTRTLAQAIQRDFSALYDYLVDRDIIWDGSEARSGRKWMLVSESRNMAFEADTAELPMTDMLVEFDNKLRFPHIPHPYPLVPESIPPTKAMSGGTSKDKKGSQAAGAANAKVGAVERRIQLAYTVATNMLVLGSDFTQSDLIDAFSKFEKTDHVGELDPSLARRGRWVLVYGILQTLASVSVDAPNVRYHEDVSYYLSPRLKGAKMPPWKTTGGAGLSGPSDEASHELSHCWTVPQTWTYSGGTNSDPNAGAESADTSTLHRRSGSGGTDVYAFPRPPPTSDSMTVRSGSTGYPSPMGGRSVRSGVSLAAVGGHALPMSMPMPMPTFGHVGYGSAPFGSIGAYMPSPTGSVAGGSVADGSVLSDSSVRQPPSARRSRGLKAPRQQSGHGGYGIPPVEEAADRTHEDGDDHTRYGGRGRKASSGPPVLPVLSALPNIPRDSSGNFLDLDDVQTEEYVFATERGASADDWDKSRERSGEGEQEKNEERSKGRSRNERPLLSGDTDESDGMLPMIRDFDDMGVLDAR